MPCPDLFLGNAAALNVLAVLGIGFLLGMRHATDADHVVAVSAIVSRERSLRGAAPIGVLWGIGHTFTVLVVGGAIILLGVVIPPQLGLGMELCVAVMLILLGTLNLSEALRKPNGCLDARASRSHEHTHTSLEHSIRHLSLRPLVVGMVHGLAGSAAIALLVLGSIRSALLAAGYLLVFGVGTIAGMLLITMAMAMPIALLADRFDRLHRWLGALTGLGSCAFGAVLFYEIGFVHGLFMNHAVWTPQ